MILSICIATYKRPVLLEKLLNSLVHQELPKGSKLEIIIVDNSPLKEAEIVIKKFNTLYPNLVFYETQKEKNISLTRNVAVKKAVGEYILFIDDDEYAKSKWILHLFETIVKFNADAVFGKVVSYFEDGTPDWIKKSFIYNRSAPLTGTIAKATRTGNCIVKASLLKSIPGPFDLKYGISGGSDTYLFQSLAIKGTKYINCQEAITFEYVPKSRATKKWLFRRAFRGGNDYTRHALELAKSRSKLLICIKHGLLGTIYFIISLIFAIILLPVKIWSMHWRLKMLSNLGKISAIVGYQPKEYS